MKYSIDKWGNVTLSKNKDDYINMMLQVMDMDGLEFYKFLYDFSVKAESLGATREQILMALDMISEDYMKLRG